MCVYIYIYVYVCMYVYIYIYIYSPGAQEGQGGCVSRKRPTL